LSSNIPAVAEAAVVARRTTRRGHVVKAFVVLAAGHEPADELAEEIKAFVRGRLSAYAYPRLVEFVDALPKTLTGKIRRVGCASASAAARSRSARSVSAMGGAGGHGC